MLTERPRTRIARRVGPGGQSVAALAGEFGVSWWAAMDAVRDHASARTAHVTALGAPRAIGLDETSFLAATPTSSTVFVTHVVNLDTGATIDVLEGRSKPAVSAWLASKPAAWRDGIDHVVIDPHQPYAAAVREWLPQARIVVDHFHIIRLANAALDEVRRRVQHDTLDHRGHRDDPLYRIRRRLVCGHDKLQPEAFDRVLAWLDRGDPDGEVSAAYLAKELLREVYDATDPMHARRRLVISTNTSPTSTSRNSPGWPQRSRVGRPSCCAGTSPACRTGRSRARTCWSRTPSGPGSGSGTSPTTATEFCSAAATDGSLSQRHHYTPLPPQSRRATLRFVETRPAPGSRAAGDVARMLHAGPKSTPGRGPGQSGNPL